MRSATGALVGALAAVAGWVAWSLLASPGPAAATRHADAPIGANTLFATAPRDAQAPVPRAAEARADAAPHGAPAAVTPVPARALPLREGQVMEHGMPTAVHAASGDDRPLAPAPAAVLPSGAGPEDAQVNAAGLVTLTRNVAVPAPAEAPSSEAPRAATATRAH